MILQIMVAFDKKAASYLTPFFVTRGELGIRSFSSAVNGAPGSAIADHPEDFALYQLGTYNDDSGKLNPFAEPVHVVEAVKLKKDRTGV